MQRCVKELPVNAATQTLSWLSLVRGGESHVKKISSHTRIHTHTRASSLLFFSLRTSSLPSLQASLVLMASECPAGQYWNRLIRKCMCCSTECQQTYITTRCTTYCKSANCRALPGHYYDGLLRKCVMCAEVCGRHPAECWQHCHTPLTPPVPYTRVVMGLEDPTLLLYPLLAVSLVLLFSSLALALVVFLRSPRSKAANSRPKEASRGQECAVQLCQEDSPPDFAANPCQPTSYNLSDDSSPTETCACVHCFPDLKALSQGHDRPLRAPSSPYPYPVLHRAHVQNGGPVLPEGATTTTEGDAQQESLVG